MEFIFLSLYDTHNDQLFNQKGERETVYSVRLAPIRRRPPPLSPAVARRPRRRLEISKFDSKDMKFTFRFGFNFIFKVFCCCDLFILVGKKCHFDLIDLSGSEDDERIPAKNVLFSLVGHRTLFCDKYETCFL